MTTLTPAATRRKKAKDAFSSPVASAIAVVIAVVLDDSHFQPLGDLDSARTGHQHVRVVDLLCQPQHFV